MGEALRIQGQICMNECGAQCCQGPSYLALEPNEVAPFLKLAERLHVNARVDSKHRVLFLEHPNECCPMLDPTTNACRIYAERPGRCRAFPEGVRPGCALSEAIADVGSCGIPEGCVTSSR